MSAKVPDGLRIWLLDNGEAGFRAQTEGLGCAITARRKGSQIERMQVPGGWWNRLLHGLGRGWQSAPAASPPDLVIACGRDALAPALQIRRRTGAFTAYIQRPPDPGAFDAVICGLHDHLAGDRILAILGSVGGINREEVALRRPGALERFASLAEPRTGVLVGGSNRAFSLTPQVCQQLGQATRHLAGDGGVMVTISRRTGAENTVALANLFRGPADFFYPGSGDNPYTDLLAAADQLLVTGDSVNMLSEACSTGRPVWIFPLPRKRFRRRAAAKFEAFQRQLLEQGNARLWEGSPQQWQPQVLAETERAADFLLDLYDRAGSRQGAGL